MHISAKFSKTGKHFRLRVGERGMWLMHWYFNKPLDM